MISQLVADLKPVKRLLSPMRQFILCLMFMGVVIVSGIYFFHFRPNLSEVLGQGRFYLELGLLLGVCFAGLYAAIQNGFPGKKEAMGWLKISIGCLFAWLCLMGTQSLLAIFHGDVVHAEVAVPCITVVSVINMGALLVYFWVLRRNRTVHAGVVATGTMGIGALGGLAIALICPMQDPVHILLWHGLPMVVSGLLLALFSRWIVKQI